MFVKYNLYNYTCCHPAYADYSSSFLVYSLMRNSTSPSICKQLLKKNILLSHQYVT